MSCVIGGGGVETRFDCFCSSVADAAAATALPSFLPAFGMQTVVPKPTGFRRWFVRVLFLVAVLIVRSEESALNCLDSCRGYSGSEGIGI